MNPFRLWSRLRAALRFFQSLEGQLVRLDQQQRQLDQQLQHQLDHQLQQQHQLDQQHQQLQHQLDHLGLQHQQLASDHAGQSAWLQQVYPEIAAAIGRKLETEQLQQLGEQLFATLHRELATRSATPAAAPSAAAAVTPGTPPDPADAADPGFYPALEARFRGSRAGVSARQQPYLAWLPDWLDAARPLLDIGCGRGEWLQLLAEHRLPARGVDLNQVNAANCRAAGLDVLTGEAGSHLASLPAGTLGAVTAFQLVEHLDFAVLVTLLRQAWRALAPGGVLILETPNPENLLVASNTFWLDPTHIRPLPPALLAFMVEYAGFELLTTLRLNPDPAWREEGAALADVAGPVPADPAHSPTHSLNHLLYGPRDYAIIARRPESPFCP